MKDYATESDIIETADPLFYPGNKVLRRYWTRWQHPLLVESFAWNTLKRSWTYTLTYFLSGIDSTDHRWDGSLAEDEVPEKQLKLVSRQRKTKVC